MARILLVDDHATNRDLLRTILGYAGHSCVEAGDGAEALELLETVVPDLVITDILMPTMDGVAFVNCLHADPRWKRLPVIFHTATYRISEARLLAGSCGVAQVLAKPCLPQEVFEAVHAALGLPVFRPIAGPRAPSTLAVPSWPDALNLIAAPREVQPDQVQETLTRLEGVSMRLVALLKANLDSAEERDPSALLTRFCRTARELVSARFAVLGMLEENGPEVRHLITQGLPTGMAGALPPSSGFLQRLLRDGRPLRVKAFGEDPGVWGLPQGTPAFASLLAIPLVSPRRTMGWLYLIDRLGSQMFSDEDESLAAALGAQLALAYENLRLVETLKIEIRQRTQSEASRRNLLEILESSEDAVIGEDLNLCVTHWNKGAEALFGYRPEEMLGRSVLAIVPTEAQARFEAVTKAALKGTRMPLYESVRIHKDGTLVQVAVFVSPSRDARGRLTGLTATMRDLTNRRRLEGALEETATQLQNVFNSIDEVVWSFDIVNQKLLTISPACTKVLGHPPETFISDPLLLGRQVSPEDRPAYREFLDKLSAGLPCEVEYRVDLPDHNQHWVRARGKPMVEASGRVVRCDGTTLDITESHRAQEELRKSEERFAQQERLAALGTLVGTVAHDVRNPLMAILAGLTMLEAKGALPPASAKAADLLRLGAEKINALMNELLEYARPRPLALEETVVADLLLEAEQACELQARDRQVLLRFEHGGEPGSILVDPLRIHQVLKNLLENAIQHSPSGGTVTVKVGVDPGGAMVLDVVDQGAGIPSQDLPRLFDPFFTRRQGGTGLGLAISLRITELHGGTLTASNGSEGGARFRMRLPSATLQGDDA